MLIVARKLVTVLRRHYSQFYYQERKLILTMIIILIIAMCCKMLIGSFRFYMGGDINSFFLESERLDDMYSPGFWLINFIIAEFIPVSALLLSFWYGLSRRNKIIRSRKYSYFTSNDQ